MKIVSFDLMEYDKMRIGRSLQDLLELLSYSIVPDISVRIDKRGNDDITVTVKGTESEFWGRAEIKKGGGVKWLS